jgi:4-hydroxybenzoate polyprenyltransferase
MNLFKTQIDHSNAFKRPDHWIGTLLVVALFACAHYGAKNNVDIAKELKKIMPASKL